MANDPDIDIIDCGTRPNWRRDMVLAALSAGKHVYNGIPFTESFESSRHLMQAWSGSGLVGGVDAFSEGFPAHRMLRELVQDGFLGRLFACNLSFHISLFNRPRRDFPYTWFQHGERGCSALRNLGSHALHVLLSVFGEVESVVGYDAQYLDEWKFDDGTTVNPETPTPQRFFCATPTAWSERCCRVGTGLPAARVGLWRPMAAAAACVYRHRFLSGP